MTPAPTWSVTSVVAAVSATAEFPVCSERWANQAHTAKPPASTITAVSTATRVARRAEFMLARLGTVLLIRPPAPRRSSKRRRRVAGKR